MLVRYHEYLCLHGDGYSQELTIERSTAEQVCSFGVRDGVVVERGLRADLDPVRVDRFERNGVEIVVLLSVV